MATNNNARGEEQTNRRGIPPKNGSRRFVPYVPGPSKERLSRQQIIHYRNHRREFLNWMDQVGKNPKKSEGYAHETVRRRAHDVDKFYRWVWDREGKYTTEVTTAHADLYIDKLVDDDETTDSHKANVQKSFKSLFRWRGEEWNPDIPFSLGKRHFQPRDYLDRIEREKFCIAAREYGSVPSYFDIPDEELAEYKKELSHRLRKPIDEIGPEDFERANGSKIPSLIYTSLDAALRPIEVARARRSWVDLDNSVLRIPYDESSKGSDNWVVALREETSGHLAKWIAEREQYPAYEDTDRLWLTRDENPYSSRSLNFLLDNLCEEMGMNTENRSITFYVLRRSTATYMTREDGLEAASHQLRHKSTETTRKYDITPVDERREALENI